MGMGKGAYSSGFGLQVGSCEIVWHLFALPILSTLLHIYIYIPRPSSYPLLGPKYLLLGTIYPQLRGTRRVLVYAPHKDVV